MTPLVLLLAVGAAPVEGAVVESSIVSIEEECHLALLELEPAGLGAEGPDIAILLTDTMATELGEVLGCDVVTSTEVVQMLKLEADRQACGLEETSCLAEIGQAFGLDHVIGGTVGKLGDRYSVQARFLNVKTAEVIRRAEDVVDDPAALRDAARRVARTLIGRELPEAPTREANPALLWGGVGALALGSAAAVVGGFIWGDAVARVDEPTAVKTRIEEDQDLGVALVIAGGVVALTGGALIALEVLE